MTWLNTAIESCLALVFVFTGSQMFSRATGEMVTSAQHQLEGTGMRGGGDAGAGGAGKLLPGPQRC